MENLTGLERRNEEAVIIGMGPSRSIIMDNPDFATNRSVALINRAGYEWPFTFDYWCSYHAERMVRWWYKREALGHPINKDAIAIVCGNTKVNIDAIPHVNITKQVHGLNMGGTSSIMAAMAMLGMGYKVVHLFGVDLNGKARSKERKFWRILKDEPLIFHGDDWFHRHVFKEVYS